MRDQLRRVPLLGGLVDTTVQDHLAALKENFSGLLLSLSPLWFGGFIVCLTNKDAGGYLSEVFSNASNGELFLYSTSVLAPILYIATADPPGARRFPSKLSHMIIMVVILFLAAGTFGVQRSGVEIVQDIAVKASLWSLIISVVLLYLATVYHNSRLPLGPEAFKEDERDFVDKYRRHRS